MARIGAEAADALATAHAAGVLHRDVKPDNLMVGRRGEVRLGDFGVATRHDASLSDGGSFLGTIAYSAPELIQGERATTRSDIFALGSTLFTLLIGRTAFASETDESPAAVVWRLLHEPIPVLPPEVLEPIREVVTRAMCREPSGRPASAEALMEELRSVASRITNRR